MSTVGELNDQNFFQSIQNEDYAVVDVYASWCGSCRLFAKVFKELAEEHASKARFFKIDGEENPQFHEKIDIDNLPFVAVYKKGEYLKGLTTSKKEAVQKLLEETIDR